MAGGRYKGLENGGGTIPFTNYESMKSIFWISFLEFGNGFVRNDAIFGVDDNSSKHSENVNNNSFFQKR